MAPAQARAQIFAQGQIHRRQAAGRSDGDAVRARVDEEREGGVLARFVEILAVVDHHQRPGFVELPGQRRIRREPAAALALLVGLAHQRAQQVGLAGAADAPQVAHRRALQAAALQVRERGRIGPGQQARETLFGAVADRADGQRQLLHPRYSGLAR